MSLPKEGSRDVHDGIIISMVPDICLTPAGGGMVPIPYTIWCRQADAANLANSVRQIDDRSHAVASVVLHCYGDAAGYRWRYLLRYDRGGVYSKNVVEDRARRRAQHGTTSRSMVDEPP